MKTWLLCFLSVLFIAILHGHNAHREHESYVSFSQEASHSKFEISAETNTFHQWIRWLGTFHLIFNHFPIALIVMTVVAEILFYWFKKSFFDQAARFMLYSAAALVIPTVLLGLALGYGAYYEGVLGKLYEWHKYLGLVTLVMTFVTLYLKETKAQALWLISLILLFGLVNMTAFFGGTLTFGPEHLTPPFMPKLFSFIGNEN